MSKLHVLIVGAAGKTGRAISSVILQESNKFLLTILVREGSLRKPIVKELTDAGAEVCIGDISDDAEELQSYLEGVDVLISLVPVMVDQKPLFLAAKKAGVRRVVPSDFGSTAPKGVSAMHDAKFEIRDYIQELGLAYTFIEVGTWLYVMLPPLHSAKDTLLTLKSHPAYTRQRTIYSTIATIGKMVPLIIADPRTLNRTVVAHDGEITLEETWKIAEKVTGEDFSDYYEIPDEELEKASQQTQNMLKRFIADFMRSLYVRGDNTLEKAAAMGHLDARKLYDYVPFPDVEEEVKQYYASGVVSLDIGLPDGIMMDVFKKAE
ncbi:NAD(P)-binding domain superfamily protein [Pleurotus pulmonarius]